MHIVRYAAAAATALALSATAPAHAASQVWQGTLFITSVTDACSAANTSVGDYYTVVYRPIISGSQSGPEGLSFIGSRSGQYWSTLSSTASFQSPALANILSFGSHATRSYATSAGGYSLIILPNVVTLQTPTVTMTGQLSNFWNVSGCNVTVSAALTERAG